MQPRNGCRKPVSRPHPAIWVRINRPNASLAKRTSSVIQSLSKLSQGAEVRGCAGSIGPKILRTPCNPASVRQRPVRSEERRVGNEGVRRVELGGRRSIKKKEERIKDNNRE